MSETGPLKLSFTFLRGTLFTRRTRLPLLFQETRRGESSYDLRNSTQRIGCSYEETTKGFQRQSDPLPDLF